MFSLLFVVNTRPDAWTRGEIVVLGASRPACRKCPLSTGSKPLLAGESCALRHWRRRATRSTSKRMHETVLTLLSEVNPRNQRFRHGHRILRLRGRDTGPRDCYARLVADAGQEDGGLLGDLPSHRPSVRSPRRKTAVKGASKAAGAASDPIRETRARPAGTTTPNAPEQRSSGAEQLARAGAGLALAPARIGLRLAGRAVDGLGKAVGRN